MNSEDIDGITRTGFQRRQVGDSLTTYGSPPMWLKAEKWLSEVNKKKLGTHCSMPGATQLSEIRTGQEILRRTPRKFAIHIPLKIAHRFERDISSGPSFSSPLPPSRSCTFAWSCEGVGRSGSLSDDMTV